MASPQRPIISPCLQEQEAKGGYVKVKQQTVGTCAIDVATGLLAPMLVAPLVAVVDVAIINSVTGDKTPVWDGMKNGYKKLFRTPHKFLTDPKWLKYTGLCWMVYAGTYSMANLTTSYIEANQVSSESAKMLKLVFSSTANIGLTLLKDILLVASVGNVKVPIRTRACFITRDVMTMGATFVIADEFGAWMARKFEGTLSDRWARQFATLTLPVMIQPFSTLLHLYGLNWAEKPGLTGSAMVNAIGRNYFISTASRMARIFPAIGLGSNINIALRDANFRQAERSRWI